MSQGAYEIFEKGYADYLLNGMNNIPDQRDMLQQDIHFPTTDGNLNQNTRSM